MSYDGDMANPLTTLGATLRLTRLVVTDEIGQWWIHDPVDQAMDRYEATHDEEPWWWKYRSGLDCPFCVGFWLGAGVLAADALTKGTRLERGWGLAKSALTLNYIAAHISSRLDAGDDEESDHE